MEEIKVGNSYICYKEFKIKENGELKSFLEEKNIENFVKSFDEDFVFVLGGDGTMLEAIKKHHKKQLSFFGINFGNKGFFHNPKNFVKPGVKYDILEYDILEIKDENTGKIEIATNEFDIRTINGRLATFEVKIGKIYHFDLEGDGMIVASQIGSTGYNSSLAGPIILHNSESFVFTPKAPWNPKLFPSIVFKNSEIVKISNSGRKNHIEIYSDGKRILKENDSRNLSITIKKASVKIKVAIVRDYLDIWKNKIFFG